MHSLAEAVVHDGQIKGTKSPIDGKEYDELEELGIEYTERDRIFYPVFSVGTEKNMQNTMGKYGRMWVAFMKNKHLDRYRSLVRFGRLQEKAAWIDEVAYELLDGIEERWRGVISRRMGIRLWRCTSFV